MMWKENYKLGVDLIDRQHKELFDRTEKLLHFIKSPDISAKKQECIDMILFLKDYAVKHFAAEEEYQSSVNYIDIENHKAIHAGFITSVLESERKMKDSDFSIQSIKDFSGFLTAWLIYHVADADQKIGTGERVSPVSDAVIKFYVTCFAHSIGSVLETMVGKTTRGILFSKEQENTGDDIMIQIGLGGNFNGNALFIFPRETVLGLIKAITFIESTEIDEIAYSALAEIANIVSGNAATIVSESGRKCSIAVPQVLSEVGETSFKNGFRIETEYGEIAVYLNAA